MGFTRVFVLLLVTSIISSVWCHHHHHGYHADGKRSKEGGVRRPSGVSTMDDVNGVQQDKSRRNPSGNEDATSRGVPFSPRRLEKMLEKAILKIITGELSTADMLLLKSLNYSLEEVLAIRERELSRRKDEEVKKEEIQSWTRMLYGEGLTKKKARHESTTELSSTQTPKPEDTLEIKGGRKPQAGRDFDFDAYNKQAVMDYESLASKMDFQQPWSDPVSQPDYEETVESKEKQSLTNFHQTFDRAMEPHVVFKIRYDDSEFDSSSGSDEKNNLSRTRVRSTTPRLTSGSAVVSSFQGSGSTSAVHTPLPVVYHLDHLRNRVRTKPPTSNTEGSATTTGSYETQTESPTDVQEPSESPSVEDNAVDQTERATTRQEDPGKSKPEYEGLEWIEDDVYRVIPAFADSLAFENNEENETSEYEDYDHRGWVSNPDGAEKDTLEYQNDSADSVKLFMANTNTSVGNVSLANLSAYQQIAIAHRREGNLTASFDSQGQRAIEDIKSKVLALTGRFNLSSNTNQVQRERLTMFSPTCQIPRNTDPEAWADPFSMNMHFQLNLTSGDHVVAAKLRIYKLPQDGSGDAAAVAGTFEEDEEDEKKIRISIYYYTKSLKKHRSKKRLMDSVVTPLTSDGTHLALDVRQGLRFWRPSPRNPHASGSNHGLVIQVEDQDGRPLKPALYIQQPSCGDHDSDQKAYQRVPALFIRACARYVRIVNEQVVTYVNCSH